MGRLEFSANHQSTILKALLVYMFLGLIIRKIASPPAGAASGRAVGFLGTAAAFHFTPLFSRTGSASCWMSSWSLSSQKIQNKSNDEKPKKSLYASATEDQFTPWNHPSLTERTKNTKAFRSRQHVNPLSSKFQQPTVLSKDWPRDVFTDLESRPIFLDIGCSRGGFLLDIATQRPNDYIYLGLEIRPVVVQHARDRVSKRPHVQGHLDFVGCNANVDLDRLLTLLTNAKLTEAKKSSSHDAENSDLQKNNCDLQMVCVQFPDPHFKSRHAKRRVVTPELVETLARFMPPGGTVFLQSDIQPVLDEMRLQFRDKSQYFSDSLGSLDDYLEENILGIPTEREVSVLEKGLPVYRALFTRTDL